MDCDWGQGLNQVKTTRKVEGTIEEFSSNKTPVTLNPDQMADLLN